MTDILKVLKGEFGLSLTDPAEVLVDAELGDYTDFSCRIVSGVLTSSQNVDEDEVPGTWCDPPETSFVPGATTFTLDLEVLQDANQDTLMALAKFCYDNDSGLTGSPVWFYMALAEGAAPKAIGQVYIAPMDFGGEGREVLTATVSWPVEGRPEIEFGTAVDVP